MCTTSGGWSNYATRYLYDAMHDSTFDWQHATALARFYPNVSDLARMLERWTENRTTVEAQYPGALTWAAGLMQAILEQIDYRAIAIQLIEDANEED